MVKNLGLIKFTEQQNKRCLHLHYNGVISYLFFNCIEIYKFKGTDSAKKHLHYVWVMFQKIFQLIVSRVLEKSVLHRYGHDFLVDYDNIDLGDILDIYKY